MNYILYLKKRLYDGRLNLFFFLIVIFTLPLNRQLFTIALWPWLLTWIIEGGFREKFRQFNFKENLSALIFLPGLFILMFLSILWSSDKANGFNQLGIQSSLIIFPVFLSFANDIYRKKESLGKIFIAFVSGTIFISLFLIIKALVYSVSINSGTINFDPVINEWESVFFFSTFSYLIHPTYFGLMVLFAASICILDIKTEICFRGGYFIKIVVAIFLFLIILLVSSKSVIIASVFIILVLGFIVLKGRKRSIISITVSLFVIGFLLIGMHPRISHSIESYKNLSLESLEDIDPRIKIWKSSLSLIKDNPILGVGTGDVKNELKNVYKKNNYSFNIAYNCHNQYLEQWLNSGIFALILLISGLFIPLLTKVPIKKEYYLSFILIVGIVFIFESILDRFWGVAFFSIFYTLLSRTDNSDLEVRETSEDTQISPPDDSVRASK